MVRRQGAGTFVNEPGLQIRSRLEEIWSYERVLEAHGYTPSVQVLRTYEEMAGPGLAQALDLEPDDRLLVITKRFLEDENPVILTCNRIPLKHITQPYKPEAGHLPVYEFLEKYCQQHLSYYLSEIVPVAAAGDVAGHLDVTPGTALISFEEIGYNTNHEPIFKATSFFRDDLLRFRLIRRMTA